MLMPVGIILGEDAEGRIWPLIQFEPAACKNHTENFCLHVLRPYMSFEQTVRSNGASAQHQANNQLKLL